jgi:hypothetical protein
VTNNTAYANGTDTCINGFATGDLSQSGGTDNVWINNVAQSVLTAANPSCGQFCGARNAPLVAGDGDGVTDVNNTYTDNVTFGGLGVLLFNNDTTYFSCSNNKCNTNPLLVSPTTANFALQPNSPAIGAGETETFLPPTAVDSGACPSIFVTCPGGALEPQVIEASVLPGSRSVQLGNPATVFASMVNAGLVPAENCRIALPSTAPAGLSLSYQTTSPTTNALIGKPDTPANIAADGLQTFLISFQSSDAFTAVAMPLDFVCDGVAQAASAVGVDTIDLTFSNMPIVDIITLAATSTNDGIVHLPDGGAAAFAVASTNVGATGTITVSVDTGGVALPLAATLCQSNPSTGQCLASPAASLTLSYGAGTTPTFSVFLQSSGPIAFSPAVSRVYVRFEDASGGLHGSTSLAIETQ